jgi:hypothetical protein
LQLIAVKYPHDRDSNIGVHTMETPMSKRVMSCGLLATVIMLGTNCAALAADDCLAGPSRPPAQGGHWYYRVDRINNRKCWYLVEPAGQTPTAEAAEPQPSPPPAPQPTFGSFFSSLTGGSTGSTSATQPDTLNSDARVQTANPLELKKAALAPKPHQSPRARPPAEHADERGVPPLNQTERDALFQEFLHWKDRRTP